MQFSTVPDEHLLILVTQGSYTAYCELFERYRRFARILAIRMLEQKHCTSITIEDCELVFYDSFSKTLARYIFSSVPLFFFFKRILIRDFNNFLEEEMSPTDALHTSISLDAPLPGGEGTLYDLLSNGQVESPSAYANVSEATLMMAEDDSDSEPKATQKSIIRLRAKGYTYYEIADALHIKINIVRKTLSNDKKYSLINRLSLRLK